MSHGCKMVNNKFCFFAKEAFFPPHLFIIFPNDPFGLGRKKPWKACFITLYWKDAVNSRCHIFRRRPMWSKIAEVKEVWLAMVDTIATWQFIYNTIQKYLAFVSSKLQVQ